ncbi:MAG: ATP-binding cassette domain-containing protein, partial [Lachnospiraceae bacterium]|nr:ATP-binding cassette domain-containing protein [Lachnospiraceae bacterium]
LEKVGMTAYRMNSPNRLSGGPKQRIAIAGMLAMKPKVILMDEPTAMLDPVGRKEVISTVHELNKAEGITIVLITHYMEEAVDADRVVVMDGGRLIMDGTPKEVFARVEELKECHMSVPQVTELAWELKKAGLALPDGILTTEELVEALESLCGA